MSNKIITATMRLNAIDRSGRAFHSLAGKMDHLNKRAGALNARQAAVARMTQGMSSGMAAAAIRYAGPAALGAAFVYAGKKAAGFEESLFNIQKKSGATTAQMAKIREEIMGLGRELPVSIDEIAAAFERGGAAGIPLDELRQFSKVTAMVADAWDTTAEGVGNTFAGFNKGLGIPLDEMQKFASLINDLADSGISDEVDIADFIDRAGASLKNFGMAPEQIAAYGAALINLKMPAEVAARAMDTVTGKLLAPENLSSKSRSGLRAIVGDLGKFEKLKGNNKLMFFLQKLEKLDNQKRASYLGAFLGEGFDDEIMRLVSGVDELRRNLEMAEKHTRNPSDSVAGVSQKKMELFNSQLKIMQNHMEAIAIAAGDIVLPTATDALKNLNNDFSKDFAVQKGLKNRGYSALRRAAFVGSQEEIDRLAIEGGYMDDQLRDKYMQGPNLPKGWKKEFEGGGTNVAVRKGKYLIAGDKGLPGENGPIPTRPERQNRYGNGGYGWKLPAGKAADDDLSTHPKPGLANGIEDAERRIRAGNRAPDPYANGGRRMWQGSDGTGSDPIKLMPSAQEFRDALKINIDSYTDGFTQSGEKAGQKVADGGKQAGESIEKSAAAISVAGYDVSGAIMSAASKLAEAAKAMGQAVTTSGTVKPPSVNADTGRSMPPTLSMPNGGGTMP